MNATAHAIAPVAEDDIGAWLKILSKYRQPRFGRSTFELLVTVLPFAAFSAAAYVSVFLGTRSG